jgi:hypothetical protein
VRIDTLGLARVDVDAADHFPRWVQRRIGEALAQPEVLGMHLEVSQVGVGSHRRRPSSPRESGGGPDVVYARRPSGVVADVVFPPERLQAKIT